MELFSEPFIQAVRQILDGTDATVLGTIPIPKGKPLGLVEDIRSRRDVKIFNVSTWVLAFKISFMKLWNSNIFGSIFQTHLNIRVNNYKNNWLITTFP